MRKSCLFFEALLIVSLIFLVQPVQAQKAKFDKLLQEAAQLNKSGKYDESIGKLDEAYAIDPSPFILWNKARNFELKKDYEQALYWFSEFTKANDEKYIKQADALDHLKKLEDRVLPKVSIRGQPQNARILIDGTAIETKPQEDYQVKDYQVSVGEHTIRIELDGYIAKEKSVSSNYLVHHHFSYVLQPVSVESKPTTESMPTTNPLIMK